MSTNEPSNDASADAASSKADQPSVALVTGGGSGIGAALCHRLARAGATVVVADIDEDDAISVAKQIRGEALTLDVSDQKAWSAAVADIDERHGRLDQLVLNAAVMSRPRDMTIDDDPIPWIRRRYELVRSVNLDGVVFGIMAALPHLQSGGGSIAVTASVVGLQPLESDPIYAMTKHGLVGLVRSLAPTLDKRGITIGAVCPGGVDTPMVSPDIRALDRAFASPDHIAQALESVLSLPASETGGIWISRVGHPMWRHGFAATDEPSAPSAE